MESGNIFFDPSFNGNMLYLGNGDSVFRGGRTAMNMEETSKRRLYFGTPEELCDEEYYDDQSPEKKRRLTSEQVQLLEKSFELDNKLEPDRKTELAKKLSLQPRQVAVWFQNRRARWKTKQMERDYDELKSSYDTLVSNYDSIVKENHKLKAELLSFTEKLHSKETAEDQKPDPLAAEEPQCLQLIVKMEGRLSSGSDGSTVIDGDGTVHLDMSSDSFFLNNEFHGCASAAVDGVNPEEDDGSNDGGSYFSDVFAVTETPEAVGWFIWS